MIVAAIAIANCGIESHKRPCAAVEPTNASKANPPKTVPKTKGKQPVRAREASPLTPDPISEKPMNTKRLNKAL